jgi:predicted nucleic acid-binding protein
VTVSEIVVAQADAEQMSRDPDDEVFLAAAVAGGADYIVSGDNHLRELETYEGIPILAPAEFVEVVLT